MSSSSRARSRSRPASSTLFCSSRSRALIRCFVASARCPRAGQHLQPTQILESDLLGSEDRVQHRREVLPEHRRDRFGDWLRLRLGELRFDDLGLGDLCRALGLIADLRRPGGGHGLRADPAAKDITVDMATKTDPVPIHPGSERALQDLGQ